MSEAIGAALLDHIPELVSIFIAILGAIVTKVAVPLIKTKADSENISKYQKQFDDVTKMIGILVESAQRLDKSGGLKDISKKDYVAAKITEYIGKLDYEFNQDQLDDIRRSAVYLLEQTEVIIKESEDIIVNK